MTSLKIQRLCFNTRKSMEHVFFCNRGVWCLQLGDLLKLRHTEYLWEIYCFHVVRVSLINPNNSLPSIVF